MSTPVPQHSPTRVPRSKLGMSWGWLVVLIATALIVAGALGTWFVTNQIAHARYADSVAARDAMVLTVPRFGDDYRVPIMAGTDLADLREGVGWYEDSAGPGEVGNFVLTGHRLGWGEPFSALGDLRLGDEIRVTTGEAEFVYVVVTAPTRVAGEDSSVLASVPGDIGVRPVKSLITLVTAADILPSPDRLVVVGELSSIE